MQLTTPKPCSLITLILADNPDGSLIFKLIFMTKRSVV